MDEWTTPEVEVVLPEQLHRLIHIPGMVEGKPDDADRANGRFGWVVGGVFLVIPGQGSHANGQPIFVHPIEGHGGRLSRASPFREGQVSQALEQSSGGMPRNSRSTIESEA